MTNISSFLLTAVIAQSGAPTIDPRSRGKAAQADKPPTPETSESRLDQILDDAANPEKYREQERLEQIKDGMAPGSSHRLDSIIDNVKRVGTVIDNDAQALNQNLTASFGSGSLRLNQSGGYVRSGNTGAFYWGPGNLWYYTGGQAIYQGENKKFNPAISLDGGKSWEDANSIPPYVFAIAKLGIMPDGHGAFTKLGSGNAGRYFLASGDKIWFEGGTIDGQPSPAKTFVNGKWDLTLSDPPTGTKAIADLTLSPGTHNSWQHPGSGIVLTTDQLAPFENNGVVIGNIPGDDRHYFVYSDGTAFTPGGGTDPANPLVGRVFIDGKWIDDSNTLGGSAYMIAKYKLVPMPDGTYRHPSDNDPKQPKPDSPVHIPQQDGSMFISNISYSSVNGQPVTQTSLGPVTFHNGRWDLGRSRPLRVQDYMAAFNLQKQENGTYKSSAFSQKNTFYIYGNNSDKMMIYNGKTAQYQTFDNGQWARSEIEDYLEATGMSENEDGSLKHPDYPLSKFYILPPTFRKEIHSTDAGGFRLLEIQRDGTQYILGHNNGDRGHRTVWNKISDDKQVSQRELTRLTQQK